MTTDLGVPVAVEPAELPTEELRWMEMKSAFLWRLAIRARS